MKKFVFVFLGLISMVLFSCNKEEEIPVEKNYVNAIEGEFIAAEGDITLKSAPVGVTRTWSMYTNNADFYPAGLWSLVDGREFIENSTPYLFWSNSANNPVSFSAGQEVYSNLTPDENLRIVLETKDGNGDVAYLGILDFNPDAQSFPLTVNGYRLGDVLTVNTDDVTTLPGFGNLVVTVEYNLAPIDLAATKLANVTGTEGIPNGTQFQWSDIVYGSEVAQSTVVSGGGDVVLYDGLAHKVVGDIKITITETGNASLNIVKTITANGAGLGMKIVLETDKIGWFDSAIPLTMTDTDISVNTVTVNID